MSLPSPSRPDDTPANEKELWSLADLRVVGLGSRSTVWRLMQTDPTFPRPVPIRGLRRWLPADIRTWLHARPRAATPRRPAAEDRAAP